jgi:hypothetical protein
MKQLTAIGTPSLFGEPGDDNENEGTTPLFQGGGGKTAGNFGLPAGGGPSANLQAGNTSGGKVFTMTGGQGQSLNPNAGEQNGNGAAGGFELPSWWPWAAAGGGALLLLYFATKKGK